MPIIPHGTIEDPSRKHPVFDLRQWEGEFPLGEKPSPSHQIDSPGELATREQALRLARTRGELGNAIPTDVFVWADWCPDAKPWLTRIGGIPWREKGKPWPLDDNGIPLVFLAQICFVDSADILPCKLPGDVALIFGSNHRGSISLVDGASLEWSTIDLAKPEDGMGGSLPWNGELPYEYHGVLHRTMQYPDESAAFPVFKTLGWEEEYNDLIELQGTCIARHASLPQGWPFQPGDGNTLIATLGSFYFKGRWPLCDVPAAPKRVSGNGREHELWNNNALQFAIGDVGCIWIYRDAHGNFKLDEAGG